MSAPESNSPVKHTAFHIIWGSRIENSFLECHNISFWDSLGEEMFFVLEKFPGPTGASNMIPDDHSFWSFMTDVILLLRVGWAQ